MSDVTRAEFEALAERVAVIERREAERTQIARALEEQSKESAARRAQQAGQGVNSRPIASSV